MPAIRITKDTPGVIISVTPHEEDVGPEESYRIPGVKQRESDVKRFVDSVNEMTEEHGLWGWCQVEVEAKFTTICGWAYLCGCSYVGKADFRAGGYYEQMEAEALAELQKEIDRVYTLIHVD